MPSGETPRQEILDAASTEISDRPAILSAEVYDSLTDLKGFRHFDGHNYRFRFDEAQVTRNEERADDVVPKFIRDIEAFTTALSNDPRYRPLSPRERAGVRG